MVAHITCPVLFAWCMRDKYVDYSLIISSAKEIHLFKVSFTSFMVVLGFIKHIRNTTWLFKRVVTNKASLDSTTRLEIS